MSKAALPHVCAAVHSTSFCSPLDPAAAGWCPAWVHVPAAAGWCPAWVHVPAAAGWCQAWVHVPAALNTLQAVENGGSDKGDTATCIKCDIAVKCKVHGVQCSRRIASSYNFIERSVARQNVSPLLHSHTPPHPVLVRLHIRQHPPPPPQHHLPPLITLSPSDLGSTFQTMMVQPGIRNAAAARAGSAGGQTGVKTRLLASPMHGLIARLPPGRTGFNPRSVHSGVSQVRIVLDGVAGRRAFSGIFRLPRPCIPALLHTYLAPPTSALKTSLLRATQISPLHSNVLIHSKMTSSVEGGHCLPPVNMIAGRIHSFRSLLLPAAAICRHKQQGMLWQDVAASALLQLPHTPSASLCLCAYLQHRRDCRGDMNPGLTPASRRGDMNPGRTPASSRGVKRTAEGRAVNRRTDVRQSSLRHRDKRKQHARSVIREVILRVKIGQQAALRATKAQTPTNKSLSARHLNGVLRANKGSEEVSRPFLPEEIPFRVGRKAVQYCDMEIGCAQPARSVYLIFSLCNAHSAFTAEIMCTFSGTADQWKRYYRQHTTSHEQAVFGLHLPHALVSSRLPRLSEARPC
ncbi:hypothetical protein PR048_031814 [Dryococelus australis]|uniref:Uncharacterized protein n=1 Tax=Dryococelus australis TaxID=614101 RepID=A0ABQ9G6C2_9NEOP|nr:hypothetical protein PR048_031814 [Dryococelus australis]